MANRGNLSTNDRLKGNDKGNDNKHNCKINLQELPPHYCLVRGQREDQRKYIISDGDIRKTSLVKHFFIIKLKLKF